MAEPNLMQFKKGNTHCPRTTETLSETNDLTIGQVFNGIANYYGKIKDEYPRWISFSKNRSEFDIIKDRVDECANDLEKVHMICDWLGEERA